MSTPANPATGIDRAAAARVVAGCVGWNQKMRPGSRIGGGIVVSLIAVGVFVACLYFSQPGTSCGGGDTARGTGDSCTYTTSRGTTAYGVTEEHGSRPWLLIIGILIAAALLALTWLGLRAGRYPTTDEAIAFDQKVADWRAHIATENPALLQNFDLEVADVRKFNRMSPPPAERQ